VEPGRAGGVHAAEVPLSIVENVVDGALHRRRVTGVEESSHHWQYRCLVRGPDTERLIDYRSKGTGQWGDQGR